MSLPKNGDSAISECLNCENKFEESQALGSWVTCDEDDGGCGFTFKLIAKVGKLEKDE